MERFKKIIYRNTIYNWIYQYFSSYKQQVLCGLFLYSKIFIFNLANHTCHSLYGAERGITTFHVVTERGWDWWNRLTSKKLFNAVLKVVWRKLSVMLLRTTSRDWSNEKTKKFHSVSFQKSSWKNWLCGTNTTAIIHFSTYAVMIFVFVMMNWQKPWNICLNVIERIC